MFLQRNTASQVFTLPGTLRVITDGSAVTSGAALTWIKDGVSGASAGTLTHISDGAYTYAPTQGETDAKICGWVLTKTGAAGIAGSIRTTNADPNDATALGLTMMPANAKQINAVATTSVATINANVGTTQPVNFTGTGSTAYVKAGLWDILGTVLTETAGQIAAGFKKFFNIVTPAATMDHLVLVDTATTVTGRVSIAANQNTPDAWNAFYVDAINGNDANDGTSWAKAKRTLDTGVVDDARMANGSTIFLAPGTYNVGEFVDGNLFYGLTLIGPPDKSAIITGSVSGTGIGVVEPQTGWTMRNLTVTNTHVGDSANPQNTNAISLGSVNDVTIENCTVTSSGGVGIYGSGCQRLRLIDCVTSGLFRGIATENCDGWIIRPRCTVTNGWNGSAALYVYDNSDTFGGSWLTGKRRMMLIENPQVLNQIDTVNSTTNAATLIYGADLSGVMNIQVKGGFIMARRLIAPTTGTADCVGLVESESGRVVLSDGVFIQGYSVHPGSGTFDINTDDSNGTDGHVYAERTQYLTAEGIQPVEFSPTSFNLTANARIDAAITSRMATFTLPTNFSALGIGAGGHILTVDTLTTYTGNTPQTGDSYGIVNSGSYGNSALLSAIQNVQNNTFIATSIPQMLERPDSSSTSISISIIFSDETGAAKNLDSGSPTITLVNDGGTDRSGRLGSITNPTTGKYVVAYTNTSTDTIEGLHWDITGTINSKLRRMVAYTQIVDTTAVDYTAADRTRDNAIKAQTDLIATNAADSPNAVTAQTTISTNLDATISSRKATYTQPTGFLAAVFPTAGTVAKAGDQMDLVNAPNATAITAIQSGLATSAATTSILNKLGAITGSGINTVLGYFRALANKLTALTPSDLTSGGGGFDNTTDSNEAIRDRGDAAWTTGSGGGGGGGSAGTGDTPVNHNTGGTDNLRATAMGNGLDGVAIYAYVASEWAADPLSAVARGLAFTGSDGRWATVMMLNSGISYTFVFNASGRVVTTKDATI